ncbi:GAL4-like zn(II)2Cys6 protein [Ceratobasidium theobromae]|uniref:GAL4-like zn(II)2Cys6 protein n=1 Tax=Ceratobasidium theobromae TaxID=1582974 RepID=A0A5N5QKQ8_9AGAM|nr:GAL4-like zn(II)2Cys6 protein [Ceratobasidium theobromae]
MPYSYAPASGPALHRGAACLECRRRKLKCDGVRPVCGCCQRGGRAQRCHFDPPEGRVFALQERIRELEDSIRAIESQPRRSRRSSPNSHVYSSTSPPTPEQVWLPSQLIALHQMPASVDWSSMGLDSPTLSYDGQSLPHSHISPASVIGAVVARPNILYDPSHSTGPFKQGRSGQDWLFNAPLGSLATVDTDPLTAFAHLARMPLTNSFDPATLSLLSSPLHDYLIASFMARRREYSFYVDEPRFLTSFALPPDHPSAVHPALRNAVYLLACRALNAQTPALAQYEPSFVDKVRQGIADALETAHQDNSGLFTGVILASTLLARYLLIMGRIREAYHQTASVARFAVSCGLHQLSSIDLRPQSPGSRAPPLLPPPTDYLSLGERIHAFWAIHGLDRTLVAVSGLPSAFGDDGSAHVDGCERITTLWPRPLGDYQSPERLVQMGHTSMPEYFSNISHNGMSNGRAAERSVHTIAAQATELHHRAHQLLHHAASETSTRLFALDRLALEFLRDLPPLDHFDDNDALHAGYNPCLVKAVALVYVAQIKLALAQQGRVAYGDQAVLEIATRVVDLLGRAHTAAGLDILVGICCAFTLGFLKRTARRGELIEQLERSLVLLRTSHVVLGHAAKPVASSVPQHVVSVAPAEKVDRTSSTDLGACLQLTTAHSSVRRLCKYKTSRTYFYLLHPPGVVTILGPGGAKRASSDGLRRAHPTKTSFRLLVHAE